jgi:rubredoxin
MSNPSIDVPFAIGETVWHAGSNYRKERVTCPDCEGTKVLHILLGNGDRHAMDCGVCNLGFEPPRGYIEHEVCVHEPRAVKLARVLRFDEDGVEYTDAPQGMTCYHSYNSKDLYRDKDECAARCAELEVEAQKNKDAQELAILTSKRKSAAHSVSYWRRRRTDARKELEAIERRLDVAKAQQ